MMHPYIAAGLAHERERELRTSPARARLVALANCCRPSRIKAITSRLAGRLPAAGAEPCCA